VNFSPSQRDSSPLLSTYPNTVLFAVKSHIKRSFWLTWYCLTPTVYLGLLIMQNESTEEILGHAVRKLIGSLVSAI